MTPSDFEVSMSKVQFKVTAKNPCLLNNLSEVNFVELVMRITQEQQIIPIKFKVNSSKPQKSRSH
jgi:hypothetical protein